jgi:hypothetical protein
VNRLWVKIDRVDDVLCPIADSTRHDRRSTRVIQVDDNTDDKYRCKDEIFGLLIGDVAGVPGAIRHMSIISIQGM